MKKYVFIVIFICALLSHNLFALDTFWHKDIALDSTGQVLPDTLIDVRISIINSSTGLLYQEIHNGLRTNQFGFVLIHVGTGGPIGNWDFNNIKTSADTRISIEMRLPGKSWVLSSIETLSSILKDILNDIGNFAWLLSGNNGTTAGTNFLGTTDDQELNIDVRNGTTIQQSLRLASNQTVYRETNSGGIPAGNMRGQFSIDFQIDRTNAAQIVSGDHSVMLGGGENTVSSDYSFIGSGRLNNISGPYSFIGGGRLNVATGSNSFIGGGLGNELRADTAFIGGGYNNLITVKGDSSVIAGGINNVMDGPGSFIGSGIGNLAQGRNVVVCGGRNNVASSNWNAAAVVVGGENNLASMPNTFVGGGYRDTASSWNASVVGGAYNKASGNYSFIGGGYGNKTNGFHSFIGSGNHNIIEQTGYGGASLSIIVGGRNNAVYNDLSFVGGGTANYIFSGTSAIVGGYANQVRGESSIVGGGMANWATGDTSCVLGGTGNRALGDYSMILGGKDALAANYGEFAQASGSFKKVQDAQTSVMVVRDSTTDNSTWVDLALDGASAMMQIPSSSIWGFRAMVVGADSVAGAAAWEITGLAWQSGFVTPPNVTAIANPSGWTAPVAIINNQRLIIRVMGSTLYRTYWVARVEVVQIKMN